MSELDEVSQKGLANAEKLGPAIGKKLGDGYAVFVRHIQSGQLSYIEIAARPVKGTPSDERHAAYSAKYFADMSDTKVMVERGRRIVRDLQTSLGIPTDDNSSSAAAG